jgi:Fusaric acid resistance protein-like
VVITKNASWPARLLDGLDALGMWLVGPDPGLNRLRTVAGATVTIAGVIGAEWIFVYVTGALLRPAPPAAAGTAAAVRVAAANHGVLIFALILGGVIGLTAATSVQDTSPRDQVVSMLVLPLPMIAALALSLAVAGHRVLALCLLPLILAAGTYLRRFGPVGVRVAPLLFTGYLFGFLLRPVITVGDIGWLTAEVGVAILVAIAVKVGVFHDSSGRALRRTQRSYAARARRLAGLALAAFDEPGPWSSRRLHRQKTRLDESAQLIDGQLADPGAAPAGSAAALLHQRLFDAALALANLARFAEALGRSPLHAGQREQVREILASLRDGWFGKARASALAFAQTLTAPAGPGSPGGDNTEIIAHRFAGSVTDFTDALSQWLELGAQDPPPGGGALFAPAVPLRQGGPLSVTAAATAEASSTAEPGRYLRQAAVAPYVRTAIQVGVAVGASIALGDLLSGQRFYWAVIGAFVIFQGTSNTEEQIGKALSRITGTLAGIVAGSALVDLIGPHAAWIIVVILASVLLGLYLQRASYAFLVIAITVTVSQLYAELGDFSSSLLVQRLEETAIGAAVAAAVVVTVLPLHASRVARVALRGYLAAMASLLRHAFAALGGAEDAALLQDDTQALNAAYQALASTIQSMRLVQAAGQSQRSGPAMAAARAARHYALNLIRDIPRPPRRARTPRRCWTGAVRPCRRR